MKPYIELNGVNSLTFGLGLLGADLPLLPARRKEREPLYGWIRALEGDEFLYPGYNLTVTLAAQGDNKAAVMAVFEEAAGWLARARFLRVWSNPNYFYEGQFEGENPLKMITGRIGAIDFDFAVNPGCAQRGIGMPAGWVPATDLPIPEQITDALCTVKKTGITEDGAMPGVGVDLDAVHPPALYLALTGTWTELTLGGALNITEPLAEAGTVYVDCDRQQVYALEAGVRRNVAHSGSFPLLPSGGALAISGTGMDLTARMIVIERR